MYPAILIDGECIPGKGGTLLPAHLLRSTPLLGSEYRCVKGVSLGGVAGRKPFLEPALSLFGRSVCKTVGNDITLCGLLNTVITHRAGGVQGLVEVALLLALLLPAPVASAAEPAAGGRRVLTLSDALSIAAEKNRDKRMQDALDAF